MCCPAPYPLGNRSSTALSRCDAKAIFNSLERAFVGFAISVVLGTVLGLALTRFSIFRRGFGPLITGLQILPSVAWVPAAIIWFGLSNEAMLFVVIMGATPSIANGLKSGVDQIPTLYPRVGTMLGARGWAQIRYVILPASLPGYLAGLRQAGHSRGGPSWLLNSSCFRPRSGLV